MVDHIFSWKTSLVAFKSFRHLNECQCSQVKLMTKIAWFYCHEITVWPQLSTPFWAHTSFVHRFPDERTFYQLHASIQFIPFNCVVCMHDVWFMCPFIWFGIFHWNESCFYNKMCMTKRKLKRNEFTSWGKESISSTNLSPLVVMFEHKIDICLTSRIGYKIEFYIFFVVHLLCYSLFVVSAFGAIPG